MGWSLITGGAGFIGSNMAPLLLERGQQVRILDNFETGRRENLTEVAADIDLHEADLRDPDAVLRAMEGVEVVYHLGALGSVPRSIADPRTTHDVNVNGTFNVLDAARRKGVRRVVVASSSSVYGDNAVLPQHEGLPLAPISPYGATKAIAEMYCAAFFKTYGLSSFALRYYNVFGPRQDPTSQYAAAVPLFVSALMRDKPPTIFGDGEQSRGFTFVSNVLDANLRAANAPTAEGVAINISTPSAVTVNHAVRAIRDALGKQAIEPDYAPPRAGDIKHSLADITRARTLLGYEPRVSFDEGLQAAIGWYRENL